MDAIYRLFREDRFANTIMNALPCGVLLVSESGRVIAVNDVMEHVFGITRQTAVGRGFGEAFCCLHAYEKPDGCGAAEYCKECEVRKLALKSLSENQPQKARVHFPLIIDGQLRDTTLLFNAAPCKFDEIRFCLLIIELLNRYGPSPSSETGNAFRNIVARNARMLELFETIRDAAPTDDPVLIQGESGTGKELVALAIHKESSRVHGRFVPVNCGALPEGLLESELFGHVKGAFTSATYEKKGRFAIADGGSIFLDEVSELSPAMQVKFLRVLQDGSFEPVGSDQTIRVNVRVISATNSNLQEKIEAGQFRHDLYYRLCVIPITLLPLRDRKEDIPLLIDHFLGKYTERASRPTVRLAPNALSVLMNYSWPGNIRELQNVLKYALVKCKGIAIQADHLPSTILTGNHLPARLRQLKLRFQIKDVAEALEQAGGNKGLAAKALGISRSSLYRFLASARPEMKISNDGH
jgi:transcriptional regulator with PAS, ATPase and Fis domain